MKLLLWILVTAVLVAGIVGVSMAAASWAADEWLAQGHPHPIHGITTYGPLLPYHRDKIIARWESVLPKQEARAKTLEGERRLRHQMALDWLKAGLASLRAGRAFYTESGPFRNLTRANPMECGVSFNVRLRFGACGQPVPPGWSGRFGKTVTVNIAIPY